MKADALLRQDLRPAEYRAPSCKKCVFFDRCGGLQNNHPMLNCFDQFCCRTGNCDHVCPYKSDDFESRMLEVGGLGNGNIGTLAQASLELPSYVPMIHHAYRRSKTLSARVVALDPYQVFRVRSSGRKYECAVSSAIDLRRKFRVSTDAVVIFRGTAKDRYLEQFWTHRRADHVAEHIAGLGISLMIGPNYSMFLDVPRTDVMFNRKRQLVCLSELSEHGVSVAPHLSALMPADWTFWISFLRYQPNINHVALNMQTGNKNVDEGKKAIERVERVQEGIGRPLRLILIGGGQFVRFASSRFEQTTLIDSLPFAKTMRRREFVPGHESRKWSETWSLERQPLDRLLQTNVDGYAQWVDRCRSSSN